MMAIIKPYRPRASAKMRIRITPTKMSFAAFALTPASPTTPMARPAASDERPQHRPDAKCL